MSVADFRFPADYGLARGRRLWYAGRFENDAGRGGKGDTLAKPNYGYEKRRKELAKKKKKEAKREEKRLRKLALSAPQAREAPGEVTEDQDAGQA